MTYLSQEGRLTLWCVDLPMCHGSIEFGYKNARLVAGVGHDIEKLLLSYLHSFSR
jgi:hypothetical protein